MRTQPLCSLVRNPEAEDPAEPGHLTHTNCELINVCTFKPLSFRLTCYINFWDITSKKLRKSWTETGNWEWAHFEGEEHQKFSFICTEFEITSNVDIFSVRILEMREWSSEKKKAGDIDLSIIIMATNHHLPPALQAPNSLQPVILGGRHNYCIGILQRRSLRLKKFLELTQGHITNHQQPGFEPRSVKPELKLSCCTIITDWWLITNSNY